MHLNLHLQSFLHFSFFNFIMFIVWSKFVSQAVRGGNRSKYSFFSVYILLIDIEFLLLVYFFIVSLLYIFDIFSLSCTLLMCFIVMWMNEINIELLGKILAPSLGLHIDLTISHLTWSVIIMIIRCQKVFSSGYILSLSCKAVEQSRGHSTST